MQRPGARASFAPRGSAGIDGSRGVERETSEMRSARQTAALEGLVHLAEDQARLGAYTFVLVVVSALAAVVAAVAAVIAL